MRRVICGLRQLMNLETTFPCQAPKLPTVAISLEDVQLAIASHPQTSRNALEQLI